MKIHELISATGDHKIDVLDRWDDMLDGERQDMWEYEIYFLRDGEWEWLEANYILDKSRKDAFEVFAMWLDELDQDEDE